MPDFLRFDVHVAGPRFDGLQENFVDQPHHRRLLGHLRQLGAVAFDLVEDFQRRRRCWAISPSTVSLPTPRWVLMSLAISASAGQHGDDRLAGGRAEFVQRVEIERIAGGDDQGAVVLLDGKHRLAMDEPLGKSSSERQIDFGLGQIDVIQADFFAQAPAGPPPRSRNPCRTATWSSRVPSVWALRDFATGVGRASPFAAVFLQLP